jgi:uncharacterized membrane protein
MSTDEANTHCEYCDKSKIRNVYRCIGFKVVGWLLLYFGVIGALLDYGQTGKWQLSRHPDYIERFFWAAVTLATPAFVGLFGATLPLP